MGLFDWGYARTQLFSTSQNQYSFTLAGYGNGKSATNPALFETIHKHNIGHYDQVICNNFSAIRKLAITTNIASNTAIAAAAHNENDWPDQTEL